MTSKRDHVGLACGQTSSSRSLCGVPCAVCQGDTSVTKRTGHIWHSPVLLCWARPVSNGVIVDTTFSAALLVPPNTLQIISKSTVSDIGNANVKCHNQDISKTEAKVTFNRSRKPLASSPTQTKNRFHSK